MEMPIVVGMSLTVRVGGYIGGGRILAAARLYTQIYESRPLSEEVKALRLGAAEAGRLDVC